MTSAEEYIRKHLKFNFAISLIDGGFYGLGIGFGSFIAVLPLFVSQLTSSAVLIGLIPAIHGACWQLPQLITAGRVSRAKRVKPLLLAATIHERAPYLGLAAVAYFLPQLGSTAALWLTFLLITWQGIGGGFTGNPWQTMVTKVIPPELHGTFFGVQSASFNGLAGLAAIAAGFVLEKLPSPMDFAACFLATVFFFALSYIAIAQTREHETPRPEIEEHPLAFWGHARAILKHNNNFKAFLVARSVSQFAIMGVSFYIIYGVIYFDMSESMAGIMTAILLIAQVIFGPLMGRLGDRWSHRGVMILGGLGAAASSLLAWLAVSTAWFYAVFFFAAIGLVAVWTTPLTLTVRFAEEHERPLYIGLSATISAPATILAPVIGGLIADSAGYHAMFLVSTISGLLMAATLFLFVKEPPK